MYAERIQKLQKELGIEITNFENIGIYASDLNDQDKEENNEFVEDSQDVLGDDDQFIDYNRDPLQDDVLS